MPTYEAVLNPIAPQTGSVPDVIPTYGDAGQPLAELFAYLG
jgi:hypothetical protein